MANDHDYFGGSLRVLNQVPRWGCIPRIKDHMVSSHSYWVLMYCMLLARHMELDATSTLELYEFALLHDSDEAATGDIIGPVKRSAVIRPALDRYARESFRSWGIEHLIPAEPSQSTRNVVKAADIIDDMLTLSEEMALGNRRAEPLREVIANRLETALERIGCGTLMYQAMESCEIVEHSPLTIIQNDEDISGHGAMVPTHVEDSSKPSQAHLRDGGLPF
jgi:5'-deoxynucleotidase YfbR-like HD superfamily hydrolase